MIKNPINTPNSVRRFIQGKPGSSEELLDSLGESTFHQIISPRDSLKMQREKVWLWADDLQIPWRDLLISEHAVSA